MYMMKHIIYVLATKMEEIDRTADYTAAVLHIYIWVHRIANSKKG